MSRFERGFSMNEQSTTKKYIALRMERQHLLTPANETEYDALYRKPLKNATMALLASPWRSKDTSK